jgi:hypothetical protein
MPYPPDAPGASEDGDETCQIVVEKPNRIELDVRLSSPGIVVLNHLFYPGWSCLAIGRDGSTSSRPVVRANRIMRGVYLTPGTYRLVYRYRPATVAVGAAVTITGWVLVACTALVGATRSRLFSAVHLRGLSLRGLR